MSLEVALRHRQGDFTLDAGFTTRPGVTALFGRSGAGKSTLAGLIAGLRKPSEGRIVLDGQVLVDTASGIFVPQRKRRIGVVFQEGRLFPHLSVRQNLLFGRRFLAASERQSDPQPIVDLLGIGALLDRTPRNLSGGEQQRVAIGRALLMQPRALILDEPLAAIDQARRAEILPYLDRMRSEMNIPMVYISHAVEEVARLADTVIVLDHGQVAAAGGTAEILARLDLLPLEDAEAGVILSATVSEVDKERGVATLAHKAGPVIVPAFAAPAGAVVRLRVHARDVAIAIGEPGRISIRNRLPATVSEIHPRANGVDIRLDLAGEPLLARLTADAVRDLELSEGGHVTALIKAVAVEGY
jgi:molybdate transport system ATP-binding protein